MTNSDYYIRSYNAAKAREGYAKPFQCEPTYSEYAANRNEGKTEGKA